jgi:nitric oxide reductase
VALKDITIGGTLIKAGEGVIAATQSGDRDESVFSNPDCFDLHRVFTPETKSLAFGHGQHQCVAEGLAKREVEIALTTLFTALPTLQLADEGAIKYFPANADVGITEMFIKW